jgi:hypothetical protein
MAHQALRMSTATAKDASIMRLEKTRMMRVLRDEPAFSEVFVAHLLARSMRVEENEFIDYKGRLEVHSSLWNVVLNN